MNAFIFRMSFLRKQESRKRAWRLQVIEKENQPLFDLYNIICIISYADSFGLLISME